MTAAGCVWLYAVVPADQPSAADVADAAGIAEVAGVAGESLHVVPGPGVAAVAGVVPREDFDEEPLRAHLEDVAWLDRTVRTHHQVVNALAARGPVLPMRYATVYHEDSGVTAMLQARRDELSAALARIAGSTEWGIKLYLADQPAAELDGDRPDEQERPGTAYLLRRKAQRDDRLRAREQAVDAADRIHDALAAVAAESTRHPLQTPQASGRCEPMLLNGAYLVPDERLPAFDKVIASCAADHGELSVEVTGPWPAYSFADVGGLPEGG